MILRSDVREGPFSIFDLSVYGLFFEVAFRYILSILNLNGPL